jgi:hypothetical protein
MCIRKIVLYMVFGLSYLIANCKAPLLICRFHRYFLKYIKNSSKTQNFGTFQKTCNERQKLPEKFYGKNIKSTYLWENKRSISNFFNQSKNALHTPSSPKNQSHLLSFTLHWFVLVIFRLSIRLNIQFSAFFYFR